MSVADSNVQPDLSQEKEGTSKELDVTSYTYWDQLFKKYDNNCLLTNIKSILSKNKHFYISIIEGFMENKIDTHYKTLLDEWIQLYHLPPESVETITKDNDSIFNSQIVDQMSQFNPYWLLEMSAFTTSGKCFNTDSASFCANHKNNFSLTPHQFAHIEIHLRQILLHGLKLSSIENKVPCYIHRPSTSCYNHK
jgi:hypothetical protein